MGSVGDAEGVLSGVEDVIGDAVDADGAFDLGKHVGAVAAHSEGVAFHDGEVGADRGGEVDFVDDEEVALGDARAAFAGDFVAACDVDHLDGEVGQFPAEAGGEVVAAGFEEEEVGVEAAVEIFEGEEVGGDILADGGVGAAAGFDGGDAIGFKRVMADQELGVLAGEDVVGDGAEVQLIAEGEAQLEHECGLAAADGAADADGEGAAVEVAVERGLALVEVAGVLEVFVGVAVTAAVGVIVTVVVVVMGMAVAVGLGVGRGGGLHGWGCGLGWGISFGTSGSRGGPACLGRGRGGVRFGRGDRG